MARVKIGNVRTPIEYLKQFFAPAGYGLGEDLPIVDKAGLDNWTSSGWFIYYDAINPDSTLGSAAFVNCKGNNTSITGAVIQEAYQQDGYGVNILTRVYIGGVWQPWEYVNPPMVPNVEYRTTERYMGLPVYTMLYDMGQLSNNGEDMPYYHVSAISGAKHLVESHVILSNAYGNEEEAFDFKVLVLPASTVQYGYKGDKSQYTGKLLIKYTY